MKKKHLTIGEFGDSFYPVMDGVAGVVKNYTEQMIRLGHNAKAIVPGYKGSEDYDEKMHLDYVIRGKNYSITKALKPYGIVVFPKKVLKMPFDIIHSHSPFFAGKETLKIAHRNNIPVISTFHTFFKDDLSELIKNKFFANSIVRFVMKYYSKIDEVWTPSEGAKKKIEKEYFFSKPIRVVENGCDMKLPTDSQYDEYRKKGFELLYQKAGIKENSKFFIFVGQHKDQKNIKLILSSMNILKNEDCHMVFVGDGHKKNEYENWVKENGLSQKIHFLGKITEREKLSYLYSASYAFVFPSLYDTSCLVMREAAAFKLPLVYIEGACTSEGRIDGVDGFIAKNNPKEFADKLRFILKNPQLRNSAGEGARKKIYKSWDDVGNEVESLYYQIIEKKKNK